MLDAVAFAALVSQCLPGSPPSSLSEIVRQASGFEPLVILIVQNGKPISVRAPSKEDAIAFAAESRIVGQRVKVGLAGLDTRDLDRLGLSLGDAFEPCTNLRAAARLLGESPTASKPVRSTGRTIRPERSGSDSALPERTPPSVTAASAEVPAPQPARSWDIYGQGRSSAALIYGAPP